MTSHTAHPAVRVTTREPIIPHARILVVDDASSCRDIFAAILSKSGYDVTTAVNGADALERFATEEFDLLLTDWEMPVLDGGRLVLALRSAHVHIPVVMLSGGFAANPLPDAISREVFGTLEKPVSIFTFLATIAAALQSSLLPILC
jgi:two-component system, chemotaxis family, chemotaxis protein CheY